MALVFKTKNVATAKLQTADKKSFISTAGVTPDEAAPANYETQINKLLSIGGKSVVANSKMTVTQIKEVVEQ